MRDAILFREATGVDQPALRFHISQRETDVDSLIGGGFDLREDVVAIERNDGLAGTSFDIFADLQPHLKHRIVDWSQTILSSGEHSFDVAFVSLGVPIGVPHFTALTYDPLHHR